MSQFVTSATWFALRDYHAHMTARIFIITFLLMSSTAIAQETYTLDDRSDTWVLTDSPEPGSPEARLAAAAKELAANHYEEAKRLASIWMTRNKRHPLLGEAHLIHGDALFAQKEFYESLFDYEFVAREFYGTQASIAANEKELQIATMFAHGLKKKLWGMRISNAFDEAEELLIRVQERLPRSLMAERAAMELADLYYKTKRMKLANDMYLIFVQNYPQSDSIDKAKARLIYTRLATYRGPSFDDAGLLDARKELLRLEKTNPRLANIVGSESLITRIDESLGQKLLNTSKWYLKVNNPISAEYTVRRLVKTHPNTAASVEALEYLVPQILPLLPPVILIEVQQFYAVHQEALLGRTILTMEPIE